MQLLRDNLTVSTQLKIGFLNNNLLNCKLLSQVFCEICIEFSTIFFKR